MKRNPLLLNQRGNSSTPERVTNATIDLYDTMKIDHVTMNQILPILKPGRLDRRIPINGPMLLPPIQFSNEITAQSSDPALTPRLFEYDSPNLLSSSPTFKDYNLTTPYSPTFMNLGIEPDLSTSPQGSSTTYTYSDPNTSNGSGGICRGAASENPQFLITLKYRNNPRSLVPWYPSSASRNSTRAPRNSTRAPKYRPGTPRFISNTVKYRTDTPRYTSNSRTSKLKPDPESINSKPTNSKPIKSNKTESDQIVPNTKTRKRSKNGCWTCRIRHKACPEDRPMCSQCLRLGLNCDYGKIKPEYMTNANLQQAKLQEIRRVTNQTKRDILNNCKSTARQADKEKRMNKS